MIKNTELDGILHQAFFEFTTYLYTELALSHEIKSRIMKYHVQKTKGIKRVSIENDVPRFESEGHQKPKEKK
jgi:hypothetical protein